jgi:hypothetical protein
MQIVYCIFLLTVYKMTTARPLAVLSFSKKIYNTNAINKKWPKKKYTFYNSITFLCQKGLNPDLDPDQ